MGQINYIFFEEFKRLDKLCGDLYQAQHGITHYIDDMKAVSGKDWRNISNWENDLNQLIRLRHIRNNLAHTEGMFEEELCTQKDVDWIRTFYDRILEQTDPIAVLYQRNKEKHQKTKSQVLKYPRKEQVNIERKRENKQFNWTVFLVIVFLILMVFCGLIMSNCGGWLFV